MVLTGRDFTLVADCGSTSASEDPGDTAARYLLSRGRMKVDALVLSHYHADHMNGAAELMRRMPVGMLLVPPPESEEARALLDFAEDRGTEVVVVSEELQEFSFGGLRAVIVPPLGNVGDNEECLCALCRGGTKDLAREGVDGVGTKRRGAKHESSISPPQEQIEPCPDPLLRRTAVPGWRPSG